MHQLLDGVSVAGIVRPGEVYIFTESKSRGCHIDPLHFSYVIKSEFEILPALELEMASVKDYYEFREYLGYKAISPDCHVFRFLCLEKPEMEEEICSLYLHRMMNLQDALQRERRMELEE